MSKLIEGYNDLATLEPQIAKEWNYAKNGDLKPTQFTRSSNKSVWWKCHICGDEWEAQINHRTRNNSSCCPKCARAQSYITRHQNKINDGKTLANLYPDLALEWDYDKNIGLSPNDVTPADHREVWWKCKRCGYSWNARISNRTYFGYGCQRCAKRFQSSFPEQAIYYYLKQIYSDTISSDHHLNIELDIYIPSQKIAVEYDGAKWHKNKESIKNDNKKNDICINNHIQLYRLREIGNETLEVNNDDYIKIIPCQSKNEESLRNAILHLISEISPDHTIDIDLTRDRGKIKDQYIETMDETSLAITDPLIAAEWDYKRNDPFTPDKITRGSDDRYYWICPKCKKSYLASVSHRTNEGTGCPYCSKQKVVTGETDLETWCLANNQEILLKEWDYTKNTGLSPSTVFRGSNTKIWWKCATCGHEWKVALYARTGTKRNGCPKCRENNRKYLHRKKVINLNTGEIFDSIKEAANAYKCSRQSIHLVLNGKYETAFGCHWDYYYDEDVDYMQNEWCLQPIGKKKA